MTHSAPKLLVIGASAGGLYALVDIFSELTRSSIPIIVTKHIGPGGGDATQQVLSEKSRLPVQLALDKTKLKAGHVYLAPSGYHLLVEAKGETSLSMDEPVMHCRPSVDVLFQSAAPIYGEGLVSLILTGANSDGAEGTSTVKAYGGRTIAQNPRSAEMAVMPKAAIDTGDVDDVVDLAKLPAFLQRVLNE